jgi:hypothetical protein
MTETPTQPLPPDTASDDEFLLAFLDWHESACPACGYNCHKLQEPRCPECALSLTLRVTSIVPVSKSWIALVIMSAATSGMGGIVLAFMAFHGWPHVRFAPWLSRAIFGYFVAMIPAPALILWLRRPFSNLPRPVRASLCVIFILWTCIMMWFLLEA